MSRLKQIIRITAISVSIIAVCIIFYMNAERFVSYDVDLSTTSSGITAEIGLTDVNSNPENIPHSLGYDMYLKNGFLVVFNSENIPVYRSEANVISEFTEKDIEMLERNGIHYSARSDLVEFLHYLKS